jgi:hypothetical protein
VAADLRPLGIGDILDASIRLYRRSFPTLIGIMSVSYGIVLPALSYAVQRFVQPAYALDAADLKTFFHTLTADRSRFVPLVVLFLANLLLLRPLVEGAIVAAAGRGYGGEPSSFGQAYRASGRRLGRLVVALTLQVLAYLGIGAVSVALGFALAFVSPWLSLLAPVLGLVGIAFLGLQFSFVVEAVMLEDAGAMAALGRSRRLARKSYGRITLVYLLGLAATFVLGRILALMAGLIAPGSPFLATFGDMLASLLGLPLSWASFVVLYYDLRVRKEGLDLERLADRVLGDAVAAA